ncbi:antibiotic biosynthesis monooxygenase [Leucobacter weissii]|uniref:Antibiotic biosynthesis monooxygenase n=1 Tax=Leucobacter weissii TaxID=1983706 RepID=A0A939SAY2_9MICO|nr:antibiotic biosynthesis monooxygenase [Leucobacter weissii]MBO1902427.1 antibiotic biosynthesis monooxygenase [Leucobacter weissii]
MAAPVTFINIIDVAPETQQEVIDLLNEGSERVMVGRPGFVSATILASLDRTRVVNVARWESADDVTATQADPAAAEFARRTAEIASPHPGLYAVAGRHLAADSGAGSDR